MRQVVIPHVSSFLAFRLHLLLVHLETGETVVIDLARLALRTEVTVAGDQLRDTAVESRVALRHHSLRRLDVALQILHAQLQNGDEIVRLQAAVVGILLQLAERFGAREGDAFLQQEQQVVALRDDEQLHAAVLGQQVLLTPLLHLHDLVLFRQRQQLIDVGI